MRSIFTFKDYRRFIKDAFLHLPKKGFGQAAKLAAHLGVQSAFISQVLKGEKSFSLEQGLDTARFLNLNELETDYFLLLLQHDRAGTREYKLHIESKIKALSAHASQLVNRVKHDMALSPEEQATFYSDWIYSAVRLSTLLPGLHTPAALAKSLDVPLSEIARVTEFLVRAQLLRQESGKYATGPLSTHLPGNSPWIKSHHTNWRLKAIERLRLADEDSLHYSAPMTLSLRDMKKIKELLVAAINQTDEILKPSPSEALVCLNIDWFKISTE